MRVFQYHSSIIAADAVGNAVVSLHRSLRVRGVASFMVASDVHKPDTASGVLPVAGLLGSVVGSGVRSDDVLILHYSFLDPYAERLCQLPVRKIIVYHNVTPSEYFRRGEMGWLADACDAARVQLGRMAGAFDAAIGDSEFNAAELRAAHYKNVGVIPLVVDVDGFTDGHTDARLHQQVRSEASLNMLFVGRMVPNKNIEAVIETLECYRRAYNPSVRLHLVGKVWDEDYFSSLVAHASRLRVSSLLRIHQNIDAVHLRTLYACADVFVSMSLHEGFMAPLVEACAAGCPVIANDAGAVGETMGGEGFVLNRPEPSTAAGLAYLLKTDLELRRRVVRGQARQVRRFRAERTLASWARVIDDLDRAA